MYCALHSLTIINAALNLTPAFLQRPVIPSPGRKIAMMACLDEITVLSVCYNSKSVIINCLAPLMGAKQVIVVDNASMDGSAEVLEQALPGAAGTRSPNLYPCFNYPCRFLHRANYLISRVNTIMR